MNATAWIDEVAADIDSRPGMGERTWCWAHVVRTVALGDLLTANGRESNAIWVEPAMAWALEDLADAGVRTQPPQTPPLEPGSERQLMSAALLRLIADATGDDPTLPMPLVDACGDTARRAAVAYHRLTGMLP